LLDEIVAQHGTEELTVQTGAKNLPALALYTRFGFREAKRWLLGQEQLELIQLHRAGVPSVICLSGQLGSNVGLT
jgi:hypothetical protein